MPISHLLSESFFLENNENKVKTGSNNPNNGSNRQVQFKEGGDDIFYQDQYLRRDFVPFHSQSHLKDEEIDSLFDGYRSGTATYKDDYGSDFVGNPVLIDTDGDISSSWALTLALCASSNSIHNEFSKFDIAGITTVNGCTTSEKAAENVCRIVENSKVGHHVKIFKGMESPLATSPEKVVKKPSFFGSDGYGDVKELPPTRDNGMIQKEHAVTGIIKMAEKYKGKLTILALGPLTNLAMAVKLNPKIRSYIKEIFIAGGNMEGTGNMTISSEFNFYIDPEAANVVLESFNLCPIFILPWETCLRSAALSQSFRLNAIGNIGTNQVKLMNTIEQKFLRKNINQWIVPDAALMACFLNREIIRKSENYHCSVETQGILTRGMMIVDKNFIGQHPANVTLITDVDRKLFGKMLILAMGSHSQPEKHRNLEIFGQEQSNFKIEPDYF